MLLSILFFYYTLFKLSSIQLRRCSYSLESILVDDRKRSHDFFEDVLNNMHKNNVLKL